MLNSLVAAEIEHYCESHSDLPHPLLAELERETHIKTLAPNMLSGHLQGEFLYFINAMLQPKKILEIGTFTGYSAIAMIAGAPQNAVLDTIEFNPEMEPIIRKYLQKCEVENKVNLHIGDAKVIVSTLGSEYDLVFIDADKAAYAQYLDQVVPKVRLGGFIIVDNVLWKGKVLDENPDKKTASIQAFNQKVKDDIRLEAVLLPLRDGLFLIRKISDES